MRRFILQRVVSIIVTLWLLATIVFAIVNVLPGNVGRKVLGPLAQQKDVDRLNHAVGADRPLIRQYFTSLRRMFTFDFGKTYKSGGKTPVMDIVLPALGRSAKLAVLAFVITIPISIGAGLYAARRQDKFADRAIVTTGLSTSAIPEFVTATMLLAVFAYKLGWGKAFADPRKGTSFFGQFEYLILPALAMAIAYFGYIARMTRSGVISALQADYTRTAVMKGLTPRQVMWRHILRNALAPTIVVISTQVGYLIGGIIGVEKVFNYHGLGSTMLSAVNTHDIPILQASVLIVGVIYMVASLVADLLIAVLNPRVRLEGAR